jgi:hypothetical protein
MIDFFYLTENLVFCCFNKMHVDFLLQGKWIWKKF